MTPIAQNLWNLPCLIVMYHIPPNKPWAYFITTTVLLGAPYAHAIVVSWVSMNAGSVRTRTVGSSLVCFLRVIIALHLPGHADFFGTSLL